MPTGDLAGWKQIFAEDFNVNSATGSWGSDCDATKIVYTGTNGTKWRSYPKCYLDTYQKRPYRADQVLSTHDGVLDFNLKPVDGQPAGANPSPVINGTSQYQTYGRYSFRARISNTTLSEYYAAILLWPQNDSDYTSSESDFPEGHLSSDNFSAFSHNKLTGQDYFNKVLDKTQWHTYTQDWGPGYRTYYIDGIQVGHTTNAIWASPERWQFQIETNGYGSNVGNLYIDWAVVYSYVP